MAMTQKLLVVGIGTTGDEVELALEKQMARHHIRNFHYKLCYLDTSNSLIRNGKIANSEFTHLLVDEHFMENTIREQENTPQLLREMLYPDFPPPPSTAAGAGHIRYAAAALLTLPAIRSAISNAIITFINQLADMDDEKSRDISFVVVISAVGATGSGALTLFLPLLLEAASHAGISRPRIDTIILHPTTSVDDERLLANAEALYAELAATQHYSWRNRYAGRTLVLGGGGETYTITKLTDLVQTAATLIRLTTYHPSGITQEYWDSLPNRGILRGMEPNTLLPRHLSSATPIAIGLSDLGKQAIQIDTARLFSHFVLGPVSTNASNTRVNTLLSVLNFLQANDSNASYDLLLDILTADMKEDIQSALLTETRLKSLKAQQQADALRSSYQGDKQFIEARKAGITDTARRVFQNLRKSLHQEREKSLLTDGSVKQLADDYNEVLESIRQLQAAAARVKNVLPKSEKDIHDTFDLLAHKRTPLRGAITAVQQNVERSRQLAAVQVATAFLNDLQKECAETLNRLRGFISAASEHYQNKPGWYTNRPLLQAQSNYPLYIPALSAAADIAQYYSRVSIFAAHDEQQQGLFSDFTQTQDPLAILRNSLGKTGMIEHCFDGRYDLIFGIIEHHVEERVQKNLEQYPLLDVFPLVGTSVLQTCITQALGRARPLLSLTSGYAAGCVEKCYVTASWNNEAQQVMLENVLRQVAQKAELIRSDDPTEIVVFYLIDGLSMPAIKDLTSRCLKALLELRTMWTRTENLPAIERRAASSIPIYSGYNVEKEVRQQGIIRKLYKARMSDVGTYDATQVPELQEPQQTNLTGLTIPPGVMQNNQNGHDKQSSEKSASSQDSAMP